MSSLRAILSAVVLILLSGHCHGHRNAQKHHQRDSGHHGDFVVDLTHTLEMERMPTTSGGSPVEMNFETHDDGHGARSEFYEFCMDEILGTHINAPSMYLHLNGTLTSDKIPLNMLVQVPAIVVDLDLDLEENKNRAELVTRAHLDQWEKLHGKIPSGSFVLLRTGWAKYFTHPDKFLGNFKGEMQQVFPGFSGEAANWLLSHRYVSGLGTECIDVELGWKTKNQVKQTLASQNKISIVQLNNLEHLPVRGFHITIAPLKLKGGSGGPARVFAAANKHRNHRGHHQGGNSHRKRDDNSRIKHDEEDPSNLEKDFSPTPPFRSPSPSEPFRSAGTKITTIFNCNIFIVSFSLLSVYVSLMIFK